MSRKKNHFLCSDDCLSVMSEAQSPHSLRTVARWIIMGFIVVILLVAMVPWQQSLPGSGRFSALAPLDRQQTLGAPVSGRVTQWHTTEGTRVAEGDPIVDITDNDPEILDRMKRQRDAYAQKLAASRTKVDALNDQLGRLQQSRQSALAAAENYIEMAKQKIEAQQQKIEASDRTLATAKLNLDRVTRLHDRGLRSLRDLELAQLSFDKATAELGQARANLIGHTQDLAAKKANREKTDADTNAKIESARSYLASAQAKVAEDEASLQQVESKLAYQSTMSVVAPRSGTIMRLLAQPGSEYVKAGDPLAILVPDADDTVVELWVKGNDMPLIHAGDPVRLQFEGWPAVQFVGWPSVAVGTFGGIVTLIDPSDDGKGRFRILVKPDPQDEPWPSSQFLRQGVRTNGWVLLETVPLWYELWRQFNGFPPVISMDEPSPKAGGKKK